MMSQRRPDIPSEMPTMHRELQRAFPNIYGQPQSQMVQAPGDVTDAVQRVAQRLLLPEVHTVLEPVPPRYAVAPRSGDGQHSFTPTPTSSSCYGTDVRQTSSALARPSVTGQLQLLSTPHRFVPYRRYNARQSYLPPPRSQPRVTTTFRPTRSGSSGVNRHNPPGRKFTKTLLLVSSDEESIPRGGRRAQLHELGAVIHLVDFWTNWSEAEARTAIECALGGMIDESKPQPRFNFLKALNGKLVLPNVGPNNEWTGEKIRQIAGQGDIYIKTTYPLCLNPPSGQNTTSEEPGHASLQLNPSQVTGDSLHEPSQPTCISPIPSSMFEDELCQLREVLGTVCHDSILVDVLRHHQGDVTKAVDELLGTEPCSAEPSLSYLTSSDPSSSTSCQAVPSTSFPEDKELPLSMILQNHAAKQINDDRVFEVQVNRDRLWRQACSFYKNSMASRARLQYKLSVEFIGEEGVDAGALKNDFFESLLKEIDERLFEGRQNLRVPKKDWGLEHSLELAGLIVAHSIVQGGPGFPVLSPVVFHYLVTLDREVAVPMASEIPVNLATQDLLQLIEKMDSSQTDEEINAILDDVKFMTIVNSSGWDPTRPITVATKTNLLQGLIIEEVIGKRERQIHAFRKGLSAFGILDLLIAYPQKMEELFVWKSEALTLSDFKQLVASNSPQSLKQSQAYDWFMKYLEARSEEQVVSTVTLVAVFVLLQFTETSGQAVQLMFMGEVVPNHGFVLRGQIGNNIDGSHLDTVIGQTDNSNCCRSSDGLLVRDWFYPNGSTVATFSQFWNFYAAGRFQAVHLARRRAGMSGIYRCNIPDASGTRHDLYVGIYTETTGQALITSVDFNLTSELNVQTPTFILTCISVGGPVERITWLRDGSSLQDGSTYDISGPTVVDAESAIYHHTLTVTGRQPGEYECQVFSTRPSSAGGDHTETMNIDIVAADPPTNVDASVEQSGSVRVTWTPPTGGATGYRIYYQELGVDDSGIMDVMNGDATVATLTLQGSLTYTITMLALSQHLPSDPVTVVTVATPIIDMAPPSITSVTEQDGEEQSSECSCTTATLAGSVVAGVILTALLYTVILVLAVVLLKRRQSSGPVKQKPDSSNEIPLMECPAYGEFSMATPASAKDEERVYEYPEQ